MDRFAACLPVILRFEGGFIDDPHDHGGATNQGVTQRVYDAHRDRLGQPRRSVRDIGADEVSAIYRDGYWLGSRAAEMPEPVDLVVFDAAVNSGPRRAAIWLQRAAGVGDDGIIGSGTMAAVRAADPHELAGRCIDAREASLRHFAQAPGQGRFLVGWLRRTAQLRALVRAA